MISAGTLQIGDGGADGSLPGAYVTNNALLTFNQAGSYTATNIITGTGILNTIGSGTLILSPLGAANTYSGGTVVNAGTLRVNGPLAGGPLTVNAGSLVVNSTIGNGVTTVNGGLLTVSGTGSWQRSDHRQRRVPDRQRRWRDRQRRRQHQFRDRHQRHFDGQW